MLNKEEALQGFVSYINTYLDLSAFNTNFCCLRICLNFDLNEEKNHFEFFEYFIDGQKTHSERLEILKYSFKHFAQVVF